MSKSPSALTTKCTPAYPAIRYLIWRERGRYSRGFPRSPFFEGVLISVVFIPPGIAESLSRRIAFWDSLEPSKWAAPPSDKPGGSGGVLLNEVNIFLFFLLTCTVTIYIYITVFSLKVNFFAA